MTIPGPHPGSAPDRLIAAHRAARAFYRRLLLETNGPRRYLADRGLGDLATTSQRTAADGTERWQLGYAPPGWTNLVDHLTGRGFTREELVAGLARPARNGGLIDVFRDRIVFPIHNDQGDPIAFVGRVAPRAGPDIPKYLNSPDTPIYHRRQTLYGLAEQHDRIRAGWAPVLVEGPIDVLAVDLAYPEGTGKGRVALAACGTSLTEHHIATICALPGAARHGITIAYDNDPAGRQATERAWRLLPIRGGLDLYAAALPVQTDPGDLITTPGAAAALRAAVSYRAVPLVHAVIDIRLQRLLKRHPDLLDHVEGRVGAVRALTSLIIDLPPEQVVDLARHVAARVGTSAEATVAAIVDNLEQAQALDQPAPTVEAEPRPAPPQHAPLNVPKQPSVGAEHGGAFRARHPPDLERRPTVMHPVPGVTRWRKRR